MDNNNCLKSENLFSNSIFNALIWGMYFQASLLLREIDLSVGKWGKLFFDNWICQRQRLPEIT